MAGVVANDTHGSAVRTMWHEAGMQFRSNLLTPQAPSVALHAHSYDHVLFVTQGAVTIQCGETWASVSAPYRRLVPAGEPHAIQLAPECALAEVLCLWGITEPAPDEGGC